MAEEAKSSWDEAQEIPSSWFSFDKVGAEVSGTLISREKRESQYGEQVVYELRQKDGTVINVGIRVSPADYLNKKLKYVPYGTIIIFKYVKDVPSKAYKGKFAKSIDAKLLGMDPAYAVADSLGGEVIDQVEFTD